LIIGKELDGQVKHYLGEIRKRREVVNVAIVIRVLLGVLIHPTKMLSQQRLAKYLLQDMGFVKRKASTSEKLPVEDFEVKRKLFHHEVQVVVEMEGIPA